VPQSDKSDFHHETSCPDAQLVPENFLGANVCPKIVTGCHLIAGLQKNGGQKNQAAVSFLASKLSSISTLCSPRRGLLLRQRDAPALAALGQ
jgi:hypothetical protein